MDKFKTELRQAWRSYQTLKKHRSEKAWARLLISAGIGLAFALGFSLIGGLVSGQLLNASVMLNALQANLLISMSVSFSIHGLFRGLELLLPQARVDEISGWRDWRSGSFFGGVAIAGTLIGFAVGLLLVGQVFAFDALSKFGGDPRIQLSFVVITLVITAVNWIWFKWRWKQQALQLSATEARLSLLQAQIEPHFLFNTLANVQSLIDVDAPRAKQMLEAFTDYLRASLGQLRQADASVATELAMAQSYLQLMQIRMGERLSFEIEASDEARSAVLPPLLLQPLIENAIHHGLEPKLEGGHIRVRAWVEQSRLRLVVEDNGLGLDARRRPGRKGGAGMALENIRARLASRYPDNASLNLTPQEIGTTVSLDLPYILKRETPTS
ncbi:sensor histidine kinase [Roseateles oligotrophus]|uniref:Histidine kinase n=1 Tax=Roseateles oligotrophus TaxID=1769250 RepID=A0ABT2YFG7_9BURK|nr:histidine kinase [Roseateles oligotrophus]MCV2368795.1 histidine kinase [Roseateles oligotrophus]